MSSAIQINPETGRKIFNTRAAKANEKITGKGYSTINDDSLTSLPPPPPGAVFNATEQAKYREFKEARRGAADYMALEGEFSKYLEDVYSAPPIERSALNDECEILVVGAGFAGLLLWQARHAMVPRCVPPGEHRNDRRHAVPGRRASTRRLRCVWHRLRAHARGARAGRGHLQAWRCA